MRGDAYSDSGLICARADGSLWKPDTFSADFAGLARKVGLKTVWLHDMRHSHATQLLQQGVHRKIVSERLGHSTIAITLDIYSHVLPGMQEDAALKVDSVLRAAIRKEREKRPASPGWIGGAFEVSVCRMFAALRCLDWERGG